MRVLLTALLALLILAAVGCKGEDQAKTENHETTATAEAQKPATTPSEIQPSETDAPWIDHEAGFKYRDITVGDGPEAVEGKQVGVHYTGWLWVNDAAGKMFDSSIPRNQPLAFQIGGGRMIAGFDQGVRGMKVGGKRQILLPPEMAYGAQGRPPVIPPNSTLMFEMDLVSVQ